MAADEFRALWLEEWGFSDVGMPENAALYLEGVLAAIDSRGNYLEWIGQIDGQQEFMFQWLSAMGLVVRDNSRRGGRLTDKGQRVLAALDAGVHYDALIQG